MSIYRDTVQKFMLENSPVRGAIVRLNQSYQDIYLKHQYPDNVHFLLGQALLSSVLLSSTIKLAGHLTLQFQSEGYIRLLVAKCNQDYHIRGAVRFAEDMPLVSDQIQLLNEGQLVVTLQSDSPGVDPYQSIIEMLPEGIAHSLECYFGQSEQIPTKMWLYVEEEHAFGCILQLMPDQEIAKREQFWQQISLMGQTLDFLDHHQNDNETLVRHLFPYDEIRLFHAEPIIARCTCNVERMENAIQLLGLEEAQTILKTNRYVSVTCDYCGNHYDFDEAAVQKIFAEKP